MKTLLPFFTLAVILPATTSMSQAASLVAHYTFDGSLLADSSGNNHNLTQAGTVTTSASGGTASTRAAQFAANGDLSVAFNPGTLSMSSMTISFWATRNGNTSWQDYLCFGNATNNLVLENTAGNYGIDLYPIGTVAGSTTVASGSGAMQSSILNHIVLTLTSGTATLYVNNVLKATTAWSATDNVDGLMIGSRLGATGRRITSTIDEVQVYDYALNASQVDFLFNNSTQVIPEPSTYAAAGVLGLGAALVALRRRKQK